MAATSPIGLFADAVVSFVEANKATILADAAKENLNIEALAVSATLAYVQKNLPELYPFLQGAIKAGGPQIVALLGNEETALFAIVDAFLRKEATALGG
jgi:hypothetical protein